jgi:hypothetical protein
VRTNRRGLLSRGTRCFVVIDCRADEQLWLLLTWVFLYTECKSIKPCVQLARCSHQFKTRHKWEKRACRKKYVSTQAILGAANGTALFASRSLRLLMLLCVLPPVRSTRTGSVKGVCTGSIAKAFPTIRRPGCAQLADIAAFAPRVSNAYSCKRSEFWNQAVMPHRVTRTRWTLRQTSRWTLGMQIRFLMIPLPRTPCCLALACLTIALSGQRRAGPLLHLRLRARLLLLTPPHQSPVLSVCRTLPLVVAPLLHPRWAKGRSHALPWPPGWQVINYRLCYHMVEARSPRRLARSPRRPAQA